MTAPLRWPAEAPRLEAVRPEPTISSPGMSAIETGIVRDALRGLRGGIDEVYRDFVTSTAAGSLGDAMLAGGEDIVMLWRSAGSDGRLVLQAAARIARVAVSSLREERSRGAWAVISGLTEWSETIGQAVEAELQGALDADGEFRSAFLRLASEMVEAAAADPVARAERGGDFLSAHIDGWTREHNLDHLWSGLRTWRVSLFIKDDVHAMLWTIRRLMPGELGPLLGIFRDPYSTMAALFCVGVERDIGLWRLVFPSAPVAFHPDGRPTGSTLGPLLLAVAYQALSKPPIDALQGEVAEPEVVRAARAVVTEAVAARPDAVLLTAHWGVWLVREGLRQDATGADGSTRSSSTLEILALLVAAVPGEAWTEELEGMKPCEAWCRRVPHTMAALAGKAAMPGVENFVATWTLTPEDWLGDRGQALDALAWSFRWSDRWPQGVGSAWLGVAFAVSRTGCWSDLWRAADTLREAVEFGDLEPADLRNPHDATNLLHLAWGIGLAALDNVVCLGRGERDPAARAGGLFRDLLDAVLEMREVVGSRSGAWDDALAHLVVRRALWSEPSSERKRHAVTLPMDLEPTAATMLRMAAGDPVEIARIIGILRRNGIPDEVVGRAAGDADIDVAAVLDAVEELQAVDRERLALQAILSGLENFRFGDEITRPR